MARDLDKNIVVWVGADTPTRDTWGYRADGGWEFLTDAGPGLLTARGVYDVRAAEVIAVGATLETWSWNGSWRRRAPDSGQVRQGLGLAYDSERGRLIAGFGFDADSVNRNTLFEWNGVQWRDVTPLGLKPTPRAFPGFAYDQESRRVIMYGDSAYSGETWTYHVPRTGKSAHVVRFATSGLTAEAGIRVESLRLRWQAGADGYLTNDAGVIGVQVAPYDRGTFAIQYSLTNSPAAAPAFGEWATTDSATIGRLMRDSTVHFAATPIGSNGSDLTAIASDSVEFTVLYRRP